MVVAQTPVIDIDSCQTWPPDIAELVESWNERIALGDDFTMDVGLLEALPELLKTLDGRRLRAYHCTRLLPHELDEVQREGLRPFTSALFDEKIDRAHELDYLDEVQHARLRAGHLGVAERRRAEGRRDTVSLSLGAAVLDDLRGVERLLGRWGGEGIHLSAVGGEEPAVRVLGQPTVIVCAVEIAAPSPPRIFPALPVVLLRARRRLVATADFFICRGVSRPAV